MVPAEYDIASVGVLLPISFLIRFRSPGGAQRNPAAKSRSISRISLRSIRATDLRRRSRQGP